MTRRAVIHVILPAVVLCALYIPGCQGPTGPTGDNAVLADSLAPVLVWLTPEPGTTVDSAATLSVQVSDDQAVVQMVFYIAGFEIAGTLTDTTAGIYVYEWSTRHWLEAPYPLMARAWDEARNSAATPVVIVQVDHSQE
jgi:hypothetical protein